MNRIKELRIKKGKTLDQMQDETGIKRGTISNYENGKTEPKLDTWQKLADYFDVPVGYLQGVTDEKELTAKYALDILDDINLQRFDKFKSNYKNRDLELNNLTDDDKKAIGSILRNFELDISDIIQSFSYSSEILEALKFFENSIYRATESVTITSDKEKAKKFETGLLFALYQATLLVDEMAIDDLLSDEKGIESIKKRLYGTDNKPSNDDPDAKN